MKHVTRQVTYLLISVIVLAGCRKDTTIVNSIPGSEFFVSATSLGTYPKAALQAFAVSYGLGNYAALVKYDVSFYKFVYKTTYKGNQIQASGLLALPKNVPFTPTLISAQH